LRSRPPSSTLFPTRRSSDLWAVAGDTPFTWTKQVASNYGGTRNGLVVHWPKGIKAKGAMRSQFHHVIDVAPTVLEVCGLPEPKVDRKSTRLNSSHLVISYAV